MWGGLKKTQVWYCSNTGGMTRTDFICWTKNQTILAQNWSEWQNFNPIIWYHKIEQYYLGSKFVTCDKICGDSEQRGKKKILAAKIKTYPVAASKAELDMQTWNEGMPDLEYTKEVSAHLLSQSGT